MSPDAALVEVLLSLYDPGQHLEPQLESLRAQDYANIRVIARDDGSRPDLVDQAAKRLTSLVHARLLSAKHVGAARSFMMLLREASPEATYLAFCDQDDVWAPGKLSRAVRALDGHTGPAMYCSAITLVTEDLRPVRDHRTCTRGPSFSNALVQNIATGCTIVLNRAAADLAARHVPSSAVMHDAWCYLLVSGCGTVLYDTDPQVLYRMHGSNTVGVAPGILAGWVARVGRKLSRRGQTWTAQAKELMDLYCDDLRPDARATLGAFLDAAGSFRGRLNYAIRGEAHFQNHLDDLAFRLGFILVGI